MRRRRIGPGCRPTLSAGRRLFAPVAYADLDLNSEAGSRTLKRRISAAGREACGGRELPFMSMWAKVNACEQRFSGNARQQVEAALRASSGSQAD